MGRLRLGSLVWPASILAGIGLGVYVLAAWPEPASRQVRAPQGQSMPRTPQTAVKTPRKVAERTAPVARAVASAVLTPQAPRTAQAAPARELGGPPPVASELESDSYRPETAEQLGAKPLPGMHPTP